MNEINKRFSELIIYENKKILVLNKPAGLAVQSGTKVKENIDDMMKCHAGKTLHLVHRLDKDTSGVLLIAKGAHIARDIMPLFQKHIIKKLYWAITVGVPKPMTGRIKNTIKKSFIGREERMILSNEGEKAETLYNVLLRCANKAAWVALQPITGRKHQLRVHCALMKTPVLGDGKYGGQAAYFTPGKRTKLHLHARRIYAPNLVDVTAELPSYFTETMDLLGMEKLKNMNDFIL